MQNIRYLPGLMLIGLCLVLSGCWPGEKKQTDIANKLVVVNVLEPAEHQDAHIVGSINVPLENLEKVSQDWPKDTKIVIYCGNYMCTASAYAAKMLAGLGFKDVLAYEGGVAEWKQKGFPVEGPAQAGYLATVGQKASDHRDVRVIEAEALKEEIDRATKAGKLIVK
jgi:rhodanese-related sulfurtransferase